jgi:hypothetical protein
VHYGHRIEIKELVEEVVGMDGLTIKRPVDVRNGRRTGPALRLQSIVCSGEYVDLATISGNCEPLGIRISFG